ncbi:MAG: serine/threonine protein kinase [Pseudomonadales bacterium]|nr:serine/threonine protein kinase [Pseudomonadales bacterium]
MTMDSGDSDATLVVNKPYAELRPGDVLRERYVIERLLGEGGQGQVFLALDREAEASAPHVAIKILGGSFRDHPEALKALRREAAQSRELSHPNIVNVYYFDRDSDHVFMVMEYMQGQSLDGYIQQHPDGAPLDEVWKIINACGEGLKYLHEHEKNIIHADFKPGNVFVTESSEIKVLDLGIARITEQTIVNDATLPFNPDTLGALTPQYASCEMFAGITPIAQDDLYALGCVTYELLTGNHPYDRKTAMEARAQKLEAVRPAGLKARQWRALSSSLAYERSGRPESVADFMAAMDPHASRTGGSSLPWIFMTGVMVVVVGIVVMLNQISSDDEFLDDVQKRYAAAPDRPASADKVMGWLQQADQSVEMGMSALQRSALDRAVAHLRTGSSSAYQVYQLALVRAENMQDKLTAAQGQLRISKVFKEAALSNSELSPMDQVTIACHGLFINRYDPDLMSFVRLNQSDLSRLPACKELITTGIVNFE